MGALPPSRQGSRNSENANVSLCLTHPVYVFSHNISLSNHQSGFVLQELQGDYQVVLTFDMDPELAGKPYSLQVTNLLGTTQYNFQLALSEKPPAGNYALKIVC